MNEKICFEHAATIRASNWRSNPARQAETVQELQSTEQTVEQNVSEQQSWTGGQRASFITEALQLLYMRDESIE